MTNFPSNPMRRKLIAGGSALGLVGLIGPATGLGAEPTNSGLKDRDPIRTELVLDLVVTCSSPERMGPNDNSKDGERSEIWPIIGGRFNGPGISGSVVPGGADFPVVRPDGVEVIDALYRLKTDDGVIIIIHNKGLYYPPKDGREECYRLVPEFTAPVGKYDWLNKSIFLSTLTEVPPEMRLAKGDKENDRLIQVHRVF